MVQQAKRPINALNGFLIMRMAVWLTSAISLKFTCPLSLAIFIPWPTMCPWVLIVMTNPSPELTDSHRNSSDPNYQTITNGNSLSIHATFPNSWVIVHTACIISCKSLYKISQPCIAWAGKTCQSKYLSCKMMSKDIGCGDIIL